MLIRLKSCWAGGFENRKQKGECNTVNSHLSLIRFYCPKSIVNWECAMKFTRAAYFGHRLFTSNQSPYDQYKSINQSESNKQKKAVMIYSNTPNSLAGGCSEVRLYCSMVCGLIFRSGRKC